MLLLIIIIIITTVLWSNLNIILIDIKFFTIQIKTYMFNLI